MKIEHLSLEHIEKFKKKKPCFRFASSEISKTFPGLYFLYYGGDILYVLNLKRFNETGYRKIVYALLEDIEPFITTLLEVNEEDYDTVFFDTSDLIIRKDNHIGVELKDGEDFQLFLSSLGVDIAEIERVANYSMDWLDKSLLEETKERFHIHLGNIEEDKFIKQADVVVLPSNPKMRYGMGVSEVLFRKAGIKELEEYCEKTFNVGYKEDQQTNDMKPKEVRLTPGFNLGCDVIFTQGPNNIYFDINKEDIPILLFETYLNIFDLAKQKRYKQLLMPSLGTGHYGISHQVSAKALIDAAMIYLNNNFTSTIDLVINDKDAISYYQDYLKNF